MIEITAKDIARVQAVLQGIPSGAQKAMAAAINRGLSKVQTAASKEVRKVYAVKAASTRKTTSVTKKTASAGNMIGSITFSGTKIPLYEFNVSPKAANTRQPVRAGVMKGNLTPFASAFITMANGRIGIFEREGNPRYPIEQKMGLSMAQMVGNDEVITEIEQQAQETVQQRLDHEINRILNGYGG